MTTAMLIALLALANPTWPTVCRERERECMAAVTALEDSVQAERTFDQWAAWWHANWNRLTDNCNQVYEVCRWAKLSACLTGPDGGFTMVTWCRWDVAWVPPRRRCEPVLTRPGIPDHCDWDTDGDHDVDFRDVARWLNRFTGIWYHRPPPLGGPDEGVE